MTRRWATLATLALVLITTTTGCRPVDRTGIKEPPPATGNLPDSMAALGDSITVGFGSCLVPTPCQRNSWATGYGTQVVSHYRRILAANPDIKDREFNYGEAKARAADLAGQARHAVEAKAQYVTVEIGANDACHGGINEMTSAATFRTQVDQALGVLKKGLPRSRVLVASIPDVYRVWQLGHNRHLIVQAWSHGVCPALLDRATSTATADVNRRTAFRNQIDAYNRELAAACRAYGSRCRWDGGKAHAVKYGLNRLSSVDFFHPNSGGQQDLADATFPGRFNW